MANTAQSGTLVAATVSTITLTEATDTMHVVNRNGAAEIFFTFASSGDTPPVPSVAGDDCYVVAAVAGASASFPTHSAPVNVSLISLGIPTFTVQAL